MGSQSSGSTKTTQTTTPWGPQQPYLEQVMQQAQNIYQQQQGVPQAPLYTQYLNQAVQQANQPIPGQPLLAGAYNNALNAANVMQPRIQDLINSGYQTNAAEPGAAQLAAQLASGTGIGQSISTAQHALSDLGGLAESNPSSQLLRNIGSFDWASPYTRALTDTANTATADPYTNLVAQAANTPNAYIPGLGGAAQAQTQNPFLSAVLGAGNQGNPYIQGLVGASGASNPLTSLILAAGNQGNAYIPGVAQSSALAMSNPALSEMQQTAAGQFLSPDTNPYLRQAVQAAQEQTQSQIASQFNQGGRYGSGAMGGQEAQQLGNIAAQAYTSQYQQERANQMAAQQAMGQQYLQGVGQLTAGQQAAAGLTQQQQYQGLLAAGQAAGLTQQQIQNMIAGQQGAAGLTQGQQQLGLGAASTAAGLQQQGLAGMLSGLTSQAQLEEAQRQLATQGMAQAGQLYGQGVGQKLQGLQAAGQLSGQEQLQAANAMNMAGNQYSQGIGQALQAWGNIGNLGAQQVQGALGGAQLYGGMSAQDIANQIQTQNLGTQAYAGSMDQALQAIRAAPIIQGMQGDQLSQLLNAAQTQQMLMQQPYTQQWNNLGDYLNMVSGNYGGTTTGRQPTYSNPYGTGLGMALGGAALGNMLFGTAGLFSSRIFKEDEGDVDREAIIDGVRSLPIHSWQYRSSLADGLRHVGPYAEDFRETFGYGDGISLPLVDVVGVMFTTMQHLLTKVSELERKLKESENASQ